MTYWLRILISISFLLCFLVFSFILCRKKRLRSYPASTNEWRQTKIAVHLPIMLNVIWVNCLNSYFLPPPLNSTWNRNIYYAEHVLPALRFNDTLIRIYIDFYHWFGDNARSLRPHVHCNPTRRARLPAVPRIGGDSIRLSLLNQANLA